MMSSPPPRTPEPPPRGELTFGEKLRGVFAGAIGLGIPYGLVHVIYVRMPYHTNVSELGMVLASLPLSAIIVAVFVALGSLLPKRTESIVAVCAACIGAFSLGYTIVDSVNCTIGPRPRDAQVSWVDYEPQSGRSAPRIVVTDPNDPADTWRFPYWRGSDIAPRIVRGTPVTLRYAEGWLGFRWVADVIFDLDAIRAQRRPVEWRSVDSY